MVGHRRLACGRSGLARLASVSAPRRPTSGRHRPIAFPDPAAFPPACDGRCAGEGSQVGEGCEVVGVISDLGRHAGSQGRPQVRIRAQCLRPRVDLERAGQLYSRVATPSDMVCATATRPATDAVNPSSTGAGWANAGARSADIMPSTSPGLWRRPTRRSRPDAGLTGRWTRVWPARRRPAFSPPVDAVIRRPGAAWACPRPERAAGAGRGPAGRATTPPGRCRAPGPGRAPTGRRRCPTGRRRRR